MLRAGVKTPKLTFFLILLGIIGAGWFFIDRNTQISEELSLETELDSFIHGVDQIWRNGESDYFTPAAVTQCRKEFKLDENAPDKGSCHGGYLNCLLAKQKKINLKQFEYQQYAKYLSPVTFRNEFIDSAGVIIEVKYRSPEVKRQIFLKDNCGEILLPERKYGYPKDLGRVLSFYWDNIGRKIFVDQNLVTNNEVRYWLLWDREFSPKISIDKIPANEYPNETLLSKEMKRFCTFKGKKLMKARIWYAAALHPNDISSKYPLKIHRIPYPWTKDKKKSFFYKLFMDEDYQLSKLDCQKAYIGGCEKVTDFKYYQDHSVSWSGMKEILGGSFEYWINEVDPKMNIKSSSRHFDYQSKKHQLGHMGNWSGKGFDFRDYYWKGEDVVDLKTGVAFRCYREEL